MLFRRLKDFVKSTPVIGEKSKKYYKKYKIVKKKLKYGNAGIIKCGFPKSGNTWLSFLMANMIAKSAGKEVDINFINHREWVQTSRGRPKKPPAGDYPSIQSNHYKYENQDYLGSKTKTIYLVRHPADVMESFYHYRRDAIKWNLEYENKMEFIKSSKYGIPAWNEHVNSWYGKWDTLVKFEETKRETNEVLREIANLIGKEVNKSTINYAVKKSSFENMKRVEEEHGHIDKSENKENFKFMREGKSDRGKEFFEKKHKDYIKYHSEKNLERLGYE